jgi:hypothetical protein
MPFPTTDWAKIAQIIQQNSPTNGGPYKLPNWDRNQTPPSMPAQQPFAQSFNPAIDPTDTGANSQKKRSALDRFTGDPININWEHILMSQALTGVGQFFANNSANSYQNATLQRNKQIFNPLNYLPENPNTSMQALYGMARGGTFHEGGEYNVSGEQMEALKKLGYELEIV